MKNILNHKIAIVILLFLTVSCKCEKPDDITTDFPLSDIGKAIIKYRINEVVKFKHTDNGIVNFKVVLDEVGWYRHLSRTNHECEASEYYNYEYRWVIIESDDSVINMGFHVGNPVNERLIRVYLNEKYINTLYFDEKGRLVSASGIRLCGDVTINNYTYSKVVSFYPKINDNMVDTISNRISKVYFNLSHGVLAIQYKDSTGYSILQN